MTITFHINNYINAPLAYKPMTTYLYIIVMMMILFRKNARYNTLLSLTWFSFLINGNDIQRTRPVTRILLWCDIRIRYHIV